MPENAFVPLSRSLPFWPSDLFGQPEALDEIAVRDFNFRAEAGVLEMAGTVIWAREIVIPFPLVESLSLVLLSDGALTAIPFEFNIAPAQELRLPSLAVAVRFQTGLLRRVRRDGNTWVEVLDSEGRSAAAELRLENVGIRVGLGDGSLSFLMPAGAPGLSLDPVMIGDTNFVLQLQGMTLHLAAGSQLPAGAPPGFRGVAINSAALYFPPGIDIPVLPSSLVFEHMLIGSSGFSGAITGTWNPTYQPATRDYSGDGAGSLFGVAFALRSLELRFAQNVPVASRIVGELVLPFFDTPLGVDLSIGVDGAISAALSATQPAGVTSSSGLVTLNLPGLTLVIHGFGFKYANDVAEFSISGSLTPEIPGLEWPTFDVKKLTIDTEGNVSVDGGWLDLPEQQNFSFYGFQLEITRLGFGKTDDGGKWIGFSGGLKLVEGLSAGASVEGLRIISYPNRPVRLTLEGAGVELEIPDVLRFKGFVGYRELPGNIRRFDGRVKVELIALNMTVDALVVFGTRDGNPFFAIYLGLDLPAGIPLWATGLGLYGIAGLFALEMEPNRADQEGWYENPDGTPGWFKRPDEGVTDIIHKWEPVAGSLGLGGGVTIGTVADNGFTFSGKLILVIVFPGPIIMLEGRASILSSRTSLNGADPLLRCLAVLDARAGSFLFGLDAHYRFGSGGELIDIRGSAEVFFSFSNASLWHIYLGRKEPRERRIRAQIIQIFEANAYFMLDARELAMGAWIGYQADWQFGPLRAVLEAWMEGNVAVSWRPVHFHGDYWIHGKVYVSAFGIGVGLSVNVRLAADVFDPFHLLGELSVGIYPPWPFPDIEVTITLEWGPDLDPPEIPQPLQEVAIEHQKISTKWPLAIDGDRNPRADDPVVPLDCRPRITFARSVHDDAHAGGNGQMPWPPHGFERIGDPKDNKGPVVVRYSLAELAIERFVAATRRWEAVPGELYGSWAAMPQIPMGQPSPGTDPAVANTKLWMYTKSGFDSTRSAGRAWDEWFTDQFPGYPCIPAAPQREVCCNFEAFADGARVASPFRCPEEPHLMLSWVEPLRQRVTVHAQPARELTHALCFPSMRPGPAPGDPVVPNQVTLLVPRGAVTVRLVVRDQEAVEAFGIDMQGNPLPTVRGGRPNDPQLTIPAAGVERIVLRGFSQMCIFRICVVFAPSPEVIAERDRLDRHQRDELVRWTQQDWVFEPDRDYRLRIHTRANVQGDGELEGWSPSPNPIDRMQYAYFRTEGPPGLANLSIPAGLPDAEESTLRDGAGNHLQVDGTPANQPVLKSELNSLAPYVRQTVPFTVPAAGDKPLLPRPVYRAYDTGVEFNENYVELLYRSRGRTLALYLFDNNNRPVRDAEGRLVILPNRWGNTAQLHLEEGEERWVTTINRNGCGGIDRRTIVRDNTLGSSGLLLDADTLYEARLIPLLFEGPGRTLEGWEVVDQGATEAPSRWEARQAAGWFYFQMNNIWGGSLSGLDPVKPGTMLLRPDRWTDFRFSVTMRNVDDDAIGLVFRYQDTANYYRFSMDRERRYRRLVRVFRGIHTVLAEDDFVYVANVDYVVAIEAIGSSLRVYQDDEPVFSVTDGSIDAGRVGLYCWNSTGARFGYMRVDDFRQRAPVVYRYAFTTSRYTNFHHHLHSFDDRRWILTPAMGDPAWNAAVSRAGDPAVLPSDDEMRAYADLEQAIGPRSSERVDVTRVERQGVAAAFLAESPEPIDWMRTSLTVERTAVSSRTPVTPGTAKLTALRRAAAQPNDESVEILLRDPLNPEDQRIERLEPPGVFEQDHLDEQLFVDRFRRAGGLLFEETFGPNALDAYTVIDQGANLRPSAWALAGGHIVQTREIWGGSVRRESIAAPGTIALIGSALWTDLTIRATLRSEDDDAIGIVFRYVDEQNYYRFSMSRSLRYRRVIRCVAGQASLLWEDAVEFTRSQSYRIELHIWRDRILGYLDDALLFSVRDDRVRAGRVGFYCWRNTGAHFEALSVESLEADPVLWQPSFNDLQDLEIHDEPGAIQGPSQWNAANGLLTQTSNIHLVEVTPFRRGTYVAGGSRDWRDVQISVTVRGIDNDALGVMFRYVDSGNYFRFSMDGQNQYRRLVRVAGGVVNVLFEDNVRFTQGRDYRLTLRADGTRLTVFLDGVRWFQGTDGTHGSGRVALYCSANDNVVFSNLLVRDLTRLVSGWTIRDEVSVTRRSHWRSGAGAMTQTADTTGGATYALAGDAHWTDYRIETRLRSDDGHAIGLVFRYIDERNHYRFSMQAAGPLRQFVRVAGGVTTQLRADAVPFVVGQTMRLSVDVTGDRIQVRVDGVRIFDVRDATLASGSIGLYCSTNPGARFEEIVVRRPSLEAYQLFGDRFLVGDMNGWTVVDEGTAGGPSIWAVNEGGIRQTSGIFTPPDDTVTLNKRGTNLVAGDPAWRDVVLTARLEAGDSTLGLLFRYRDANNCYRFSMDRRRGYRRLVRIANGVFTTLWERGSVASNRAYDIAIVATGQELRGYMDGVPMFVVRDATIVAGRIGLYCWANPDARFSNVHVYPASRLNRNWLLQDTFTTQVAGRWTFVDQTQGAARPQWRFVPDELRQTTAAFGGNPSAGNIEKPGTFALAGDAAWADYRLTVRWISDSDGGIGIMFRYTDADNYYRFSMDRQLRYRRLVKFVAGHATELWVDRMQYSTSREYAVTIEMIGSQIAAYIDGIELFRVDDGDLAQGRIGLYSWRNDGARFLEVQVSPARWRKHYQFGAERTLAAGTRIRIHSGAEDALHDADPGLVRRFVAAQGESGQIHFGEGPVMLRISGGHCRSFVTGHVAENVRLLRKRDGTGFFIVPTVPTFPAGGYRFRLTYRRAVTAVHPETQVLSEAGVTSDEVAWIDVPWSGPVAR